jgi:transcriptional regulator with XRE-family HTH domain
MPSANRPSVRFRRIGSALRQAREARGMTVATAVRRYGRSKGWFSTLENGLHTISPEELSDLLDFYTVTDPTLRESLLDLAAHNAGENWSRVYEGRISAAAHDMASLETDSVRIATFQPNIIPGLLQTEEYASALMRAGLFNPMRNNRALVSFRMDRQAVLKSEDPPHYETVIGEAALHQQVGGADVLCTQLHQLSERARLPYIDLRVLPFAAEAHLGIAGSFDILTLRPPGNLSVVLVDDFTQSTFIEREPEVATFERIFKYFQGRALSESASLAFIERLASES